MKKKFLAIAFVAIFALAVSASADTVTLSGNLSTTPNGVSFFNFTIGTPGTVDILFNGGFDSIFSLFDGSGQHLITNDDSIGLSSHITQNLAAGSYTLAVSQYSNFSNAVGSASFSYTDGFNSGTYWIGGTGTLADGFNYDNYGYQWADYDYTVTLDSDVQFGGNDTPEPASLALLGSGLVGMGGMARRKLFNR